MDKQTKHTFAEVLFSLSVIAVILAAWSYLSDSAVWLASSQWVQVAAVLGIYAVYMEVKDSVKKK